MRGGVKNFLLRPSAREKERNTAERHHADGIRNKGKGHYFSEAAHLSNVLFVMRLVDDRAGAEEEQRFEKSMGEQMHDAGGDAPDAERDHHQAELRDG